MRSNLSVVSCCVIAGAIVSADTLTRKLADAFEKKIVLVQRQSETPSKTARSTSFTQDELNAYLKYKATSLLPTGLTEPVLVSGRSVSQFGQSLIIGRTSRRLTLACHPKC